MSRARDSRTVLFVSSNGVGLGHLTRQMAVAERLPPGCRPLFMTMSYAAGALRDRGLPFLFVPHHGGIGLDVDAWNGALADEIGLAARHFGACVLVYDATAVFGGVLDAMARDAGMASLWIRRPMWRDKHRSFLSQSDRFDAVIEPEELAEAFDDGPTRQHRAGTIRVAPILHLSPGDRLERSAARKALGLDDETFVVALQLGSDANFDVEDLRRAAVAAVLRRPGTAVLEIRSPIRAAAEAHAPALDPRHRRIELFPAFRYSRAFDGAVSAAGYNGFHEAVIGAVPTIFVPNEAEDMDLQVHRARWAEATGRGWMARQGEGAGRIASLVDGLIDDTQRSAVAARCREIAWTNGADAVVAWIADRMAPA